MAKAGLHKMQAQYKADKMMLQNQSLGVTTTFETWRCLQEGSQNICLDFFNILITSDDFYTRRSYSAFPKIDEDLPAMHEPDEMIMRGPMLGGASVWVSPGADAGFATDLSASSTNLPGSPMSMHASAAAAGEISAEMERELINASCL
eukprot:1149718-Pelagomonas_calceolata.AAC.6